MYQLDRILLILCLRVLFTIGVLFSYSEMTNSNYKHCPIVVEWEKVDNICSFLACFYEVTCVFSGTKYPIANLKFLVITMIYVSLKEELMVEDEHKKLMAT
jgi:hypothetical protein